MTMTMTTKRNILMNSHPIKDQIMNPKSLNMKKDMLKTLMKKKQTIMITMIKIYTQLDLIEYYSMVRDNDLLIC